MPEPRTETPAFDAHGNPAASTPHRGRWLAAGALLLGLFALAFVLLTRDDSHAYRFVFDSAGQLVTGDIVRVGGTPVGDVTAIELTDDSLAEVTVSVADEFAPFHEGTTATIRAQGLVGVANRYVDVHPGPNFRSELEDGATLEHDNTTAIVELDQLFNTLDQPTRDGLTEVIDGFATWYEGKEQQANAAAKYFSPGLAAPTRFVREVNRDSAVLGQFLTETSKTLGVVAERRADLAGFVSNGAATARALSSDTESLSLALRELPPALREGSDFFVDLRPALDDLEALVVASEPSAQELGPFLRRLRPVVERSVPTFRELRLMFKQPGAGNDLYDAMRELPQLAKLSSTALPRSRRALKEGTPIFSFARPYVPELTSWLRNFAGAAGAYDANGHYVRAQPIFDAFDFIDDAEGGSFQPKPPAARGQSPYLKVGNLRRCPGTAAPAVPDGSTPFVDMGALARPDCDPSQVVGSP